MQNYGRASTNIYLAILLLIISLQIVSCTNSNDNSKCSANQFCKRQNTNAVAVKTMSHELSSLIKLPEQPEEVSGVKKKAKQKAKN